MVASFSAFRKVLTRRIASSLFAALVGIVAPAALFAVGDAGTDTSRLPTPPAAAITKAADLIKSSFTAVDAAQRDKILAKAQAGLEEFLRDNPTHGDAPLAELELGAVHVTAGQAALFDGARTSTDADRAAAVGRARERFNAAEKLFTTAIDQLGERMKLKVGDAKDGNQHATLERQVIKGNHIRAQMCHAGVLEELAATYAPETREARVNYQAAADRYEEIYKNYRTLTAGLTARLRQGLCYRNLGDPRRALGLFSDILGQPETIRELHRLRVQAMSLSLECWNSEQEKLHELAFTEGEGYLTKLPRNEELWPEWQAVRFHTAQGYLLAATTKKKDGNLPADRAEWLVKAREHAEKLGEQSGPYKAAVDALLNQIRKSEAADGGGGESRLGLSTRPTSALLAAE